jgi:hypothetical protein
VRVCILALVTRTHKENFLHCINVICGLSGSTTIFSHSLIKGKTFWESDCGQNMCFDFLYNICLLNFSFQEKISDSHYKCTSSWKLPVMLVRFEWNVIFLDIFSKSIEYTISCKSVVWEPNCFMRTDRQTDRQTDRRTVRWMDENTDMTKLIVAFLNFAYALKKKEGEQLSQIKRGRKYTL